MDGLLPKGTSSDHPQAFQHHISHSRSGSRKFQRHPDCIPERVDLEQQQSPTPPTDMNQVRLQEAPKFLAFTAAPSSQDNTTSAALLAPSETKGAEGNLASIPPVPSPNIGARRQKVTAKAKKRQKALEDDGIS
uniref:Uncharacterized protein n=1 Tax=Arion vulgaris TaxID=1028688 RepID=A0A0B6ZRD8_9EUPU